MLALHFLKLQCRLIPQFLVEAACGLGINLLERLLHIGQLFLASLPATSDKGQG